MAGATGGLIRAAAVALLVGAQGCAGQFASASPSPAEPAFWARGQHLGRPPATAFLNANGSPRVENPAHYAAFLRNHAARIEEWSRDSRLRINPNLAVALVAKESAFDPLAMSAVPAYGIAQITYIADLDLVEIVRAAPVFRWMLPEVESWPRVKAVHDSAATRARIEGLLARGLVTPVNEYLFTPETALRASNFWLRVLATIWTEDTWPGMYGSLAREKLGADAGGNLPENDLLNLVIVSYNQGHPYAADLLRKYGRDWTRHLNPESADYLERIREYTVVLQMSAAAAK
jgi:hypothetical protein